ncbi:MlaD family protein [Winogradskyella endarachnes]|uniref:MCE family protein n=1 Tax=Winogradskyella endarachnes TaxID=2681965 RepID=A0A6L6U562_9FLAO|nr:MlaD family protein [Winogradskyella endarachnes]MUU77293.1 MCE family protein [Winogradskyella endarachnes]
MKISREVKTAVLVLAGIAFCIYLFTYLKGEELFTTTNTYYTEFDYNSLSMASPVTVKGNKIGKIKNIYYDFDSGKTKVAFKVTPDLKFSKNSVVRLYQDGLMGGNGLAIIDANDGNFAKDGDFIKSEIKPGMISSLEKNFSGISEDLGSTLRSSDSLLTNLNALVDDESEKGLKQTIAELNSTLRTYNRIGLKANSLLNQHDEKLGSILDNFDTTTKELAILMKDLNKAELANTVKNLDELILKFNQLATGLQAGDGSLGKFLKDDNLYDNLENATKELELLLLDIKLHPARYRRILSKKEIPYQEPTEAELNNN